MSISNAVASFKNWSRRKRKAPKWMNGLPLLRVSESFVTKDSP